MSPVLQLAIRTPDGPVFDGPVDAVTAEDVSGWFGILPGRRDLVAVLPPGLLTFRDARGDHFVALSGGMLDLRRGRCRVMAREAQLSDDLERVATALAAARAQRQARGERRSGALAELEREAIRRFAREARA